MKSLKTLAVTVCALMTMSMSVNAYEPVKFVTAENPYNIKANGVYLTSQNYIYNNNLYIPIRDVCESLGAEVSWDAQTRTVTVKEGTASSEQYNGTYIQERFAQQNLVDIEAYPDSVILNINGQQIDGDNFIFNGKTFITVDTLTKITSHLFVDNNTRTLRVYSPSFAQEDCYVLADGEKLSEEDFFDIADFVYQGNLENALMDNFASIDNYFIQSSAIIKVAEDLGIDMSEKAISEFMKNTDITAVASKKATDYTDIAKENIMTYYYAYVSLGGKDLEALFNPTDEELSEYYKNIKYSSALTIKAQHILIEKGENNEGLEKINELLKKAKEKDADFTKLMLENSQDPGSQSQPDGYIFTDGEMVEEFYEAALKTPVGEISDVFETSYGYHIVKKIAQWDDGMPMEEMKDELLKAYNSQKLDEEFFDKLIAADVYFDTQKATDKLLSEASIKE